MTTFYQYREAATSHKTPPFPQPIPGTPTTKQPPKRKRHPHKTPPIGQRVPGTPTSPKTSKPGRTPTHGQATPPPAKPPAKRPVKAAAPTMSPFEAFYRTNPAYLASHPQYENQKNELYAQYGWVPNGHGGYAEAQGAGSEFSLVHQLEKALAGQSQQIQDSANSRGLLFSGAQGQLQQNVKAANQKQTFDAQHAFQQALGGVNMNESNLISSLYDDYVKNAPPGGPPKVAGPVVAKPGVAKPGVAKPATTQVVQPFGAGRSTSPWMKNRTPRRQPPAGYKPPVSTSGWNATASQYDPKIHYWGATR